MTTNNLNAIKAILNVTLNNFSAIRVEGKPESFTGELVVKIMAVKDSINMIIADIDSEIKENINASTDPEFK